VLLWDAATDSFQFQGIDRLLLDGTLAGDGNVSAVAIRTNPPETRLLDENLLQVRKPIALPDLSAFNIAVFLGQRLHASGSLLYVPTNVFRLRPERSAVDIYDAHHGGLRGRVFLPETYRFGGVDSLALDEAGKKIFANTESGITMVELASVPLSIGSVRPEMGPSAGGTRVTIRGSGFQSGAVVKFGSTALATTFVDENTLSVTTPSMPAGAVHVTIANPDGEEYSLDAGFHFN
jgi:hypothetical protein